MQRDTGKEKTAYKKKEANRISYNSNPGQADKTLVVLPSFHGSQRGDVIGFHFSSFLLLLYCYAVMLCYAFEYYFFYFSLLFIDMLQSITRIAGTLVQLKTLDTIALSSIRHNRRVFSTWTSARVERA